MSEIPQPNWPEKGDVRVVIRTFTFLNGNNDTPVKFEVGDKFIVNERANGNLDSGWFILDMRANRYFLWTHEMLTFTEDASI